MSDYNQNREMYDLTVELNHQDLIVTVLNGYGDVVAQMLDPIEAEERRVRKDNIQYLDCVWNKFTLTLPRGIYQLEGELGGQTESATIRLNRDISVDAPVPCTFSAVPVANAPTSHEYYTGPAIELSRKGSVDAQPDPNLMVFIRTIDSNRNDLPEIHSTLTSDSGDVVFDSMLSSYACVPDDGWLGFSLSLLPGGYILELRESEQQRCIPLWITDYFQMQLFGMISRGKIAYDSLRVLNAERHLGFEPENKMLITAEVMTSSLIAGSVNIMGAAMRDALQGKFYNPIVGLFAAHHLLRRNKVNESLIVQVIDNLSYMLGDSPDVKALKIMLCQKTGADINGITIHYPPILRASYQGIIDAASEHPEIVVNESLFEKIGVAIFTDIPFNSWDPILLSQPESSFDWIKQGMAASLFQNPQLRTTKTDIGDIARSLGVTSNLLEKVAQSIVQNVQPGVDSSYSSLDRLVEAASNVNEKQWELIKSIEMSSTDNVDEAFRVIIGDTPKNKA